MKNKEFREILLDFLHENELTQSAFALKVGIKQSQVSEWIKGKAKPGYDLLRQIALAYKIPADYLLGIVDYY
jgi:transcriptional regulator with XRE-family HTH domain